jgi:hypothetical protein
MINSNGSPFYTASAGKKIFLHQAARSKRKNETQEKKEKLLIKTKENRTGESGRETNKNKCWNCVQRWTN